MELNYGRIIALLLSFIVILVDCFPKQMTFELPDRETLCFYEDLEKNEEYTFMFQVLKGGLNDVDVIISDPQKQEISKKQHSTHETQIFTPKFDGAYSFCFGNQFSSISHKVIFFELRGRETLREEAGYDENVGPSSLIETLAEKIHEHLTISEDYQTELRAKKLSDRLFAVDLVDHISLWSAVVSVIIVVTVIAQVSILKSFFKDKKNLYTPLNSHY